MLPGHAWADAVAVGLYASSVFAKGSTCPTLASPSDRRTGVVGQSASPPRRRGAYSQRVAPDWVRLTLKVDNFDDRAFEHVVDRCSTEGIVLKTMTELGDHEANHRRLYELNRICSADIPERGEFYTYDEYRARRIGPDYEPSTTVIALDNTAWVGMSAASDHRDEGFFFNEMTGVIRSHRSRGIALAMKVMVIRLVRDLGVPEIRTFHHPDNKAPIALNRRLGYVDAEAPLPAE